MAATESRRSSAAEEFTAAAVASFANCPDPRLRTVLEALVRHLHAFASEVNLTEDEWTRAIQILTETGHLTDDKRSEFILWSDTLGLSMLVDALAHPNPDGTATESTVLGPFWTPNAPRRAYGESLAEQPGGTPALVCGRVLNTRGEPIPDAELDIWQSGDNGLYAVQDDSAPDAHLRGRYLSRGDGTYAFLGVEPVPYTIPHDGPVGAMLQATRRHPWRPAHIHMIVTAPGYRRLQTHIFDSRSAFLDSDVVFAVKPSLIREFVPRGAEDPETPAGITGPWCLVENDIVLQALND